MSKDIIVKLRIDDKGNIAEVGRKADKTSKSLDNFSESAHNTDRRLKGASQQSSNTTKNFSKMAQGITGGLVPAYATLAANIFAISAVFRFLSEAADFRVMLQGQMEFAAQTGTSLALMTREVQAATDAQLAFKEASQAVAIGRAAGLSKQQIIDLADVAKNASLALGRDLTDSFQRLTRGAIKAEPELLDELGIIVRLNDATKEYARQLKLDANALNTFQKSQAVVNATIQQGQEKFGDLNIEVNSFTKLAKTFDDVLNTLKESLAGFAEFLAKALAVNPMALGGAGALLGTGLAKAMIPAAPTIDPAATMQAGLGDLGRFYTGKNMERFTSGQFGEVHLKNLERSINANTSKVINATNMTKGAMLNTVARLRAANAVMVAEQSAGFTRMRLKFVAELRIMEAEYGKTMGRLKFAGATAMKGLSAVLTGIGIAGLFLSLGAIVQGIINSFKDPAILEFEQAQNEMAKGAQRQARELEKVVQKLKVQKDLVSQLTVQSRVLANITFTGEADTFGGLDLQKERTGARDYTQYSFSFSKQQLDILDGTIRTLNAAKSQLGGQAAQDVQEFIDVFSTGLGQFADEETASKTFDVIMEKLIELNDPDRGLGKNVQLAKDVADAITFLDNSYKTFGQTIQKIQLPTTPFANLRTSIRDIAAGFETIAAGAPMLSDAAFKDGDLASLIGTNYQGMFGNILGAEATKLLADAQERINKADDRRVQVGIELLALSKKLSEREQEILSIEMQRITAKRNLTTATALEMRFATNLQKKEIQARSKIADLDIQKQIITDKINLIQKDGTELTKEQKADFAAQLQSLEAQKLVLQDSLYLMTRIGIAAQNAFESGATEAFSSLIKGERPEEGRTIKFAKGIADALTNELASSMSRGLSDMLFGKKDPAARIQTAMLESADYHGQVIRAAIAGEPAPAFPGGGASGNGGLFSGFGLRKFLFGNQVEAGIGDGGRDIGLDGQVIDAMHATQGADTGNLFQRLFMSSDRFGDSFFKKLFGGNFGGAFNSFFGLAKGGIMGYSSGGVARQPTYIVGEGKQHEAVVPLPDNRSIPVDLKGGTGTNNVNVNVDMGSGKVQTTSEDDGFVLGQAISAAVVKEIERQQRPGGQLSSI